MGTIPADQMKGTEWMPKLKRILPWVYSGEIKGHEVRVEARYLPPPRPDKVWSLWIDDFKYGDDYPTRFKAERVAAMLIRQGKLR